MNIRVRFAIKIKIECNSPLKKYIYHCRRGGSENYDEVDGGMCSRGDMGSVKALTHVLEVGGETEVGG